MNGIIKKKESAIETVYLFSANLINEIHGKPLMWFNARFSCDNMPHTGNVNIKAYNLWPVLKKHLHKQTQRIKNRNGLCWLVHLMHSYCQSKWLSIINEQLCPLWTCREHCETKSCMLLSVK